MGHFFRCFAALTLLSCACPFAVHAEAPQQLKIVRVTPNGEDVPTARQIVLEFNRPVVPVGNMARKEDELGITITPPVKCDWRWLNTTSLACNLGDKEQLQKATAYKIHVDPKIAAADGATIAEAADYNFITQRARSSNAGIDIWKSPVNPALRVSFNQPVTKDSAAAHIYFEDEKNGARIAASVHPVADDTRKPEIKNGVEARDTWMITPKEPLPANAPVTLKQEAGLVSSLGDEASAESAEIRRFYTFPEFSFRGVVCQNLKGEETVLPPGSPQTESQLCDPMRPVSLSFTAPVLFSKFKDGMRVEPRLVLGDDHNDPWANPDRDWSRLSDQRSDETSDYRIGFPVGLKAAQDYRIVIAAPERTMWQKFVAWVKGDKTDPRTKLEDEFGRALPPLDFKFATGHRNPNYELVYRDAVLEKNIDSDVPVYVNNLEQFTFDYHALTADGVKSGSTDPVLLPKVIDKQFAVPGGVRDILGGRSGAVYANLATTPAVPNKYDGASRLFAQVTPYQVYVKLGHFRSSVWVTDLASGAPVGGATVNIYQGTLAQPQKPGEDAVTATTDENGVAELPGTEELDPSLVLNRNWKDSDSRLFVRVDKDGDMALLPLNYDYEVQLWNIASDLYANNQEKYGHMKAWGMTAQGIYRAGDTMQYKLYVRGQDNQRFVAPPAGTSYSLTITDPTGKTVEERDLELSTFGTADGEYAIPATAAIGWYNFKLTATLPGRGDAKDFYPLSVLVSDFTPAPFRVTTELNGDKFKTGDKLEITSAAALHSGGPFGNAAVRTTVTLTSRNFTSSDPAAKDFAFGSFEGETGTQDLLQKEDRLNDKGEFVSNLELPSQKIYYGRLRVESAVRDDRGKSIASEAQAEFAGVDRFVGLKPDEWVFAAKEPASVQTVVVDAAGKPAADTPVRIVIEKEDVSAAKVKGAGNAYLNDNTVTWQNVGKCDLDKSAEPQSCRFTPDSAGTYRMTATVTDTKGREQITRETLYVSGNDYVQWNEGREYALTILPEQENYRIGDTARYLVKNPWPNVYALVTVERYGVLDHFVQKLEGSAPVIEIPVKEDYAPGFYLSVVAMSPRVEAPPPEPGQIDMGKPAFRAGYVKTGIVDPFKSMSVSAKPAQEVYRPGDTVSVALEANPLHQTATQEPIELAVAVLDESVFDLIADGKNAFDPYHGFYDLDSLDVSNYSLLTRLIGRQKFEKKGANPGGDGGVDAGMRNLFKYVSYWNPSVPVGADGRAEIEFAAPDNLTGWRVLALAATPTDRMGLGEANFKVNRPTELRPVMPNQVREGDKFSAGFSVMNRTDHKRTLTVTIKARGDLKDGEEQTRQQTLELEPYKRTTVTIPLEAALLSATRDIARGSVSFTATASDAEDTDGLEHRLDILKSRTVQTSASYGTTTEDAVEEQIAIPEDIYTDSGNVSVTLSPSVIAGLDGAFRYLRDYPYPCWEQKLTMAVMASHYKNLKPYLDDKTLWNDASGLPEKILAQASSHQAPSGGMAYFTASDDRADPYLSAYTALAFRWLKTAGHDVPVAVETGLEGYLLNFLRNDAAPDHYQDGMTSTVRATILAAYAGTDKITASDVSRFQKDVKRMNLFGKAQYLAAAGAFPETADAARKTLDQILSAGIETGGKFSFNETYDEGWMRLLATPLRDNCAALDALLAYPDQTVVGDKPFKLVRMITQSRGQRDHFENTQENMFCMNALVDYAKKYEQEEPRMEIAASFDDKTIGTAAFSTLRDKPVTLARPIGADDENKVGTLSLRKEGPGRLYYTARLRYAAKDLSDPVNAGIDIRREYSVRKNGKWVVAGSPVSVKRGDLVRVDLYLSLPAARNFLVVDDPLPGGLETVNTDLATASKIDDQDAMYDRSGGSFWFKYNDWIEYNASFWSFYHRELRHDAARYYADWLEPGNYHLSYMAQAVATGTFSAPPVKAEEMYDPDIYGLGIKSQLVVDETQP